MRLQPTDWLEALCAGYTAKTTHVDETYGRGTVADRGLLRRGLFVVLLANRSSSHRAVIQVATLRDTP